MGELRTRLWGIGLGVGMALGVVLGLVFLDSLPIGVGMGVALGVAIAGTLGAAETERARTDRQERNQAPSQR